jgi:hypothetical protein
LLSLAVALEAEQGQQSHHQAEQVAQVVIVPALWAKVQVAVRRLNLD